MKEEEETPISLEDEFTNERISAKKKQIIKRTTAKRVLEETIVRAKEINTDDRYLYGIERISIFGSYLKNPKKEYVGDLDIMIKLTKKKLSWKDSDIVTYSFAQALREKPEYSFIDKLFYSYNKTVKRLKNRSRTLSIHDMNSEGGRLGKEKVIFKCKGKELIVRRKLY